MQRSRETNTFRLRGHRLSPMQSIRSEANKKLPLHNTFGLEQRKFLIITHSLAPSLFTKMEVQLQKTAKTQVASFKNGAHGYFRIDGTSFSILEVFQGQRKTPCPQQHLYQNWNVAKWDKPSSLFFKSDFSKFCSSNDNSEWFSSLA